MRRRQGQGKNALVLRPTKPPSCKWTRYLFCPEAFVNAIVLALNVDGMRGIQSKVAFSASKLTEIVFKIVEFDDIFIERPLMYAKVLPDVVVVIDTGCGGRSDDAEVSVTSLREFIETWPVDDNGGRPLNEGGTKGYVVVCTHCHYDHIRELSPLLTSSLF